MINTRKGTNSQAVLFRADIPHKSLYLKPAESAVFEENMSTLNKTSCGSALCLGVRSFAVPSFPVSLLNLRSIHANLRSY